MAVSKRESQWYMYMYQNIMRVGFLHFSSKQTHVQKSTVSCALVSSVRVKRMSAFQRTCFKNKLLSAYIFSVCAFFCGAFYTVVLLHSESDSFVDCCVLRI